MVMNLYYADGDQQVGPIGKAELQSLVKAKKVNAKTLVWQDGMEDWQELGVFVRSRRSQSILEDQAVIPTQRSVCSECGRAFAEEEMIRFNDAWICAGCKPAFIQKVKEGVSVAGAMNYAGLLDSIWCHSYRRFHHVDIYYDFIHPPRNYHADFQ